MARSFLWWEYAGPWFLCPWFPLPRLQGGTTNVVVHLRLEPVSAGFSVSPFIQITICTGHLCGPIGNTDMSGRHSSQPHVKGQQES